ncbi:hypothetical protein NW752_000228 [Fusarium irregulare]|uniref:Uncharacterized protein n=1 Tax=Fusarium irregulare TaxID=2494466 RepID=A0A9W8PZ33_9HYPO|nr:hypothetical protein NW766_001606 [Fusarium irregulare]KAJ4027975.1 hypothetical protein NW752_000228 [Fusarium irregulare]
MSTQFARTPFPFTFSLVFSCNYYIPSPLEATQGGLEYLWNLLGLNETVSTWLDIGLWTFEVFVNSQRQPGDKWYALWCDQKED